ncbi:hypothetical protein F1737_06250 [Methanoplanus sp. FWC-SCC4]|uniref:Formyl transferase N-terminal domain-containing protein n=1 Tax=Methanochimaera problematica TaxID=2609417 RepID=A0AA97FCB8_9EURY|nr:formyltransferase family protein [Methanoplanus sp. FWC-SCC4]WOF16344.1 hypothetical protein F1737_06250 [Methanoplanus sp. FWC-SCC4]
MGTKWSITSCECLSKLISSDFNILIVVSGKEKGYFLPLLRDLYRGIHLRNKDNLKKISRQNSISYIEINDVNSLSFIDFMNSFNPDIIFCCIFDQILKKNLINVPNFGAVNYHPSLLPDYRGADPYFWVIKNGENETGVTIHYIDERPDTGDIILQKKHILREGEDISELRRALSTIGSDLAIDALNNIFKDNVVRVRQDIEGKEAPEPKMSDYIIDNTASVKQIYHFIRGVKSLGPIFKFNDEIYFVKDSKRYELYTHNMFPKYEIIDNNLFYYGVDGMVLMNIESKVDQFLKKIICRYIYQQLV